MESHQQDSTWRPILTGTLAERAHEVIQDVADRLQEIPADWIPESLPKPYRAAWPNNPSLAQGRTGQAIFYAYLAQAWARDQDRRTAVRLLEEAIDLLAAARMRPSLFGGFTGVAWATEHLRGRLLDADAEEDSNDVIDDALIEYLGHSPWQAEYDLVHGLVGFGVYALERLPRESAVTCLKRVIDRLEETAERNPAGVTWLTAPGLLPPHQQAQSPRGHYNVGVAHGMPAVIALLGEVCAVGLETERVRALLDGAVRWLLAQKLPDEVGSTFPYWVDPDSQPGISRLAWCYGDPGVAATLLHAARCVGHAEWEQEALEMARRATKRDPDDSGVLDVGLCHGASGLGHLFNRMYQASGDEQLGDAARFWFERTFELRRADEGIAGFSAWMAAPGGEESWVPDPYFLTGAAGVALALLGASTNVEPAWDRVMFLSIPPRTT